MPANACLMTGIGTGSGFRLAESCPAASEWAAGAYMSHQGDPGSFAVADVTVRDGSAAVRVAVWRCVHCGVTVAGLGSAGEPPDRDQPFTWLELDPDGAQ